MAHRPIAFFASPAAILRDGFESRAGDLQTLARREFRLEKFMRKEPA